MRSSLADNGADATQDAVAWLSWADEHADSIDPLLRLPRMPADPVPDLKALEPHLGQRVAWAVQSDVWIEWRQRFDASRGR